MKRDTIIIEDKAVSVTGNDVWMTATEIAGLFHTTVPAVNAAIRAVWKSHSTLTLLATQDLPTFLYYMIDPLKSWCWGAILFYPFKNSRFS